MSFLNAHGFENSQGFSASNSREFNTRDEALEFATQRVSECWITHMRPIVDAKNLNLDNPAGHPETRWNVSWWVQ